MGLSFTEIQFITHILMMIMLLVLIFISVRNFRIAKVLIKDKTIMFAEVETDEDYNKLMTNKNRRFKLTEETTTTDNNNENNN